MTVVGEAVEYLVSAVADDGNIPTAPEVSRDAAADAEGDSGEKEEVQEEAAEDSDAIVRGAVEFLVKQCEDTGASPPLPEEGKESKEAAEDAEEEAIKQVDDGSEKKEEGEEKEGGLPPVISMPQQLEEAPLLRLGGPDIPESFSASQGGSAPSSGSPSRSGSRPGSGARHRRRVVNRSRANSIDGKRAETD